MARLRVIENIFWLSAIKSLISAFVEQFFNNWNQMGLTYVKMPHSKHGVFHPFLKLIYIYRSKIGVLVKNCPYCSGVHLERTRFSCTVGYVYLIYGWTNNLGIGVI